MANNLSLFLLQTIPEHPTDIVAIAEKKFGISRMSIHRELEKLITDGKVFKTGRTKSVHYSLADDLNQKLQLPLNKTLDEFGLMRQYFPSIKTKLPDNIYQIFEYGLTEIVNNAKDHSLGKKLWVETSCKNHLLSLIIIDDGIGIFKKLQNYLHFEDPREGILLLNKGKFTTDRTNHTGEGIFFSSRIFDNFTIEANGINYSRDNNEDDWYIAKSKDKKKGTRVELKISIKSKRDIVDVFKKFQDPETLAFNRTEITVDLSKFHEEHLVSRSQAVRILRNLERFKIVTLDFRKIDFVGQGFVDQIFRVFHNAHPTIEIRYINANTNVKFMIERGLATGREQ